MATDHVTTDEGHTMDEAKPRYYTIDEAQQEIARRECMTRGHDFDVMVTMRTMAPVTVLCRRCHESWCIKAPTRPVERGGAPKSVQGA